jgi:hypothetical protein
MLNIIDQINISQMMKSMSCHFQTVYTKETQMFWDKILPGKRFQVILIKHVSVFMVRKETCNCAVAWKDKQNMNIPVNMHCSSVEGNVCN